MSQDFAREIESIIARLQPIRLEALQAEQHFRQKLDHVYSGNRRSARNLVHAGPFFAYPIEHIISRRHGGEDESGNLCLACYRCNATPGPNLSGLDPESGGLSSDPRSSDDRRAKHLP